MQHRSHLVRLARPGLCGCLLAVGINALAADFFRDETSLQWTATSGSGDSSYLEHRASANAGIYGIRVAERADRPQEVNVLENLLTSGAGRALGGETLRIFNGAFGFQDAVLPPTHHATALQVCENNRRIKGLRLWGRRLDAAGLPTGETMLREFKRTNCGAKDWAEKVACADDRVAVGVRVNYYGNLPGSKTTFSGLALQCGRMK